MDHRSQSNDDELYFGVLDQMLYARNTPSVPGAQWTGIITQVGMVSFLWVTYESSFARSLFFFNLN